MSQQIKTAFLNSRETLIGDCIGALALIVMFFAGLSLPSVL